MSVSRMLFGAGRRIPAAHTTTTAARSFRTAARLMEAQTIAVPVRKPVGAFRGGLFGFLIGTVGAGSSMYYYVLNEYKVANEMLTEDIYALQQAVQRLEGYVRVLEEKSDALAKKQK